MSVAVKPKAAAICVVRDSADIILLACAHYLRLGVERLVIIDDSSSDGTFERVQLLAERGRGRIVIRRVVGDDFLQPDLFNTTINELIAEGFRLIVPFDADEFWDIPADAFDRLRMRQEPRIIVAEWVSFVQRRDRAYPTPLGLLSAQYRADARPDVMDGVRNFTSSFVHLKERKIAIWADEPINIMIGQHGLIQGPAAVDPQTFDMFHLPLRYRSEITKRALNYEPRRARLRANEIENWQSAFHRRIVLDNKVDAVWAANSVDGNGELNLYGRSIALTRDRRLRDTLLRAAWYLFRKYRLLPF